MNTWGAACQDDVDCVALLGPGAVCMREAIVFELPYGYCSKPCTLPDPETTLVRNAADCDPEGGVMCVGLQGFFERCVPECTGNEVCGREGYFCRPMPYVAGEGDPEVCLVDDCCENGCSAE
jgi:hypothetical protein